MGDTNDLWDLNDANVVYIIPKTQFQICTGIGLAVQALVDSITMMLFMLGEGTPT